MSDEERKNANRPSDLARYTWGVFTDKKLLFRVSFSVLGMFTIFWLYVSGFLSLMPRAFRVLVDGQLYFDLLRRILIDSAVAAFTGKLLAFLVSGLIHSLGPVAIRSYKLEASKNNRKFRLVVFVLKKAIRRYETVFVVALSVLIFVTAHVGVKYSIIFAIYVIILIIILYIYGSVRFFRNVILTPNKLKKVSSHRIYSAAILLGAILLGVLSLQLGKAQFILRATRNIQLIEIDEQPITAAPVFASKGGLVLVLDFEERNSFFLYRSKKEVEIVFIPYSEISRIIKLDTES